MRPIAEKRGRQSPDEQEAPAHPGRAEASDDAWLRPSRPWPPVSDADGAEVGEGEPGPLDLSGPGPARSEDSELLEHVERRDGNRRAEGPDDEDSRANDLDDIAVTIGRVVSIRGPVIWGALFDDSDGLASRAARMGALVSMKGPESRVFGIVNALQRDQASAVGNESERTVFEIQVLGEIATCGPEVGKGFQRGVSSYPPLDAPVTTVTLRDIAAVYARPRASAVHVGRLRHNRKVPAFVLTDSLLGKHFAILGTTGTGKSCAVTVILRSILDEYPNGHVVLADDQAG